VGKWSASRRTTARSTVHPHVRGEMTAIAANSEDKYGSSPRAWGNEEHRGQRTPLSRFIPTCVGKWARTAPAGRRTAVHPHVRGEMRLRGGALADAVGSSPRAWGNDDLHPFAILILRFIPTCVGKWTCSAIARASLRFGSSPRAWGNVFTV